MQRGQENLDSGRLEQARKDFETARMLDPSSMAAVNDLGVVLYRRGDYLQAETLFRQAMSGEKEMFEARVNLGLVLNRLKRWDELLELCDQSLKRQPGSGTALFGRGVALYELGRFEEAVTSLESSIEKGSSRDEYFSEARRYLKKAKARALTGAAVPWER
jgi:tetratricopeptide (TPR) repeat protein